MVLCLSSFYFGFNLTAISSTNLKNNNLTAYFGAQAGSNSVIGGIIGALPVGAAIGALIAPFFMAFLSRK